MLAPPWWFPLRWFAKGPLRLDSPPHRTRRPTLWHTIGVRSEADCPVRRGYSSSNMQTSFFRRQSASLFGLRYLKLSACSHHNFSRRQGHIYLTQGCMNVRIPLPPPRPPRCRHLGTPFMSRDYPSPSPEADNVANLQVPLSDPYRPQLRSQSHAAVPLPIRLVCVLSAW